MKKIATILLTPFFAFAFSLVLNSGKEEGKTYSILHLKDDSEFACEEQILAYDKKIYTCEITGKAIPKIEDKILSLVSIDFINDANSTKIIITPMANSRLISYGAPLFDESNVIMKKNKFSKHHSVLVDRVLSEFDKTKQDGINFAVTFEDMKYPSVGALDLNKAPIENLDSNDINLYLDIKKDYEAKRYDAVISGSETALRRYESSIFASEFILYRLRALDKILQTQDSYNEILPADIANEGKAWMRRFTSDENYSEVLYLVTKSYIKQDMMSDANYTLDILMSEHPNSHWTKMAILEFADRLYDTGRQQDAIRMYENVLYSAQTIDVASRAALSLVESSIDSAKFENAKEYMLKILNANENYILNDIAGSVELAGVFHEKKMDDAASRIYEILVANLKKDDDHYEAVLKNLGLSLIGAGDKDKAYAYLKRYQQEFPQGQFSAQVELGADKMYFELGETNATKLHEHYSLLIEKYGKNEIGQKALREKVALYVKQKKFNDALRYSDALRDINDSEGLKNINLSALMLAREMIRKDDCKAVVNLVESHEIKDEIEAKFKLFDCYMRLSRYGLAYELAGANITAPDMLDRIEWLVKLSSVLLKMEKFNDVVRVADEALAIAARQEYADVSPVFFDRFEALVRLGKLADAAATIKAIEDLRENDFRIIESYDKMSAAMFGAGDFAGTIIYAKKTLDMQNRLKIDTFSPRINFEYVSALNRLERYDDATAAAKELLGSRLGLDDRVRALAQISEIYIKQKKYSEARPLLRECVQINSQSPWKSLCAEQVKLVE